MDKRLINCGIQIIPITEKEESYAMIDSVIDLIKSKNHKTLVTPFETVVEATFFQISQLLQEINDFCCMNNKEFVLNIRMHINPLSNVLMDEKTSKHK